MRTISIFLVLSCIAAAQPDAPAKKKPQRTKFDLPEVSHVLPAAWKTEKSRSTMRKGTWVLPGKTDTRIILYWFGNRGAGGLEDNLERWKKQVRSDKKPTIKKLKMGKGLSATLVDVSGTYVAPVRPGAQERHDKPGHRLLGAYVETPDGPLYVKVVGPDKIVGPAKAKIVTWLEGFRYEGRPKPGK